MHNEGRECNAQALEATFRLLDRSCSDCGAEATPFGRAKDASHRATGKIVSSQTHSAPLQSHFRHAPEPVGSGAHCAATCEPGALGTGGEALVWHTMALLTLA